MRRLLPAVLALLLALPIGAKPTCPPRNPHCTSSTSTAAASTPTIGATPSVRPSPGQTPTATATPSTPAPTAQPTLIFSEDFSQTVPLGSFPSAVSDRWTAYPYPWSTLGGYYHPQKVVSWHDGYMDYWLHAESGQWLMAAALPRIPDRAYGRYELRWKADALAGYYWVPLLWPDSENYLRDGEIDWPEGNLTGTIHGFIHHTDASSGADQKACTTGVPMAGQWHTTVTDWRPGSVRLYLDGALVCEETVRTPDTPFHLVLQATTSPSGLPPAGTSGHLLIDSLRIWSN